MAGPLAAPVPRGRHPIAWVAAGAVGILALLLLGYQLTEQTRPEQSPSPSEPGAFPLTPTSASPYLNTGPDARYIGSGACKSCHGDRHDSFRRTGMGQSMAALDPAKEPAGATYDHPLSKRRYQIVRRDGRMWHREFLLGTDNSESLLSEHPVTYVVGSGRHSRSYFCEPDGFMVESPATWYTLKKAWAMSPGYDRPHHGGFAREVGMECLICHAGRVEPIDGTLHKIKVIEAAIGCERCHGPGSLHAERQRSRAPGEADADTDLTIVNPRRLSRDLAESICQQCHLRPTAAVLARGHGWGDFRPGLPLQDFLHTFQSEADNSPMTVVGHVEQLHLSKCYKNSSTLTCVTCHDPHGEPKPDQRVAYYRAACLTCHQAQHCKVSEARRLKESPDNDCAKCHMPRSDTEIPHLAFSHHRIGIHGQANRSVTVADRLVPFLDLGRLSEMDQKRSLGLGYLEAANRDKDPRRAARYREEARSLLLGVRSAGLRDPSVEAALARIHFDLGNGPACPPEVLPFAEAALALPGIRTQDRCMALYLQAAGLAAEGLHADALAAVRELTRLRRHPADWMLVAECEQALGHEEKWIEALLMVTRIEPGMSRAHRMLAEYYLQKGEPAQAAMHRARAVP